MSAAFDPYWQWLGIPAEEQPPDYYALLGVARFESDPQVLAQAADQRMAHIRSFQTGPRGAYTQPILNELAAARLCLLNPAAKASYDQMLQGLLMASSQKAAPPPVPAVPVLVAASPAQPIVVATPRPKRPSAKKKRRRHRWAWWAWPWWALGLIGGGIAAVVGGWLWLSQARVSPSMQRERGSQNASIEGVSEPRDELTEPVLVHQETNGSVHLMATSAQLHGPSLSHAPAGDADVISHWESLEDWASWTFKVVQLPPNGLFRVLVTYAAMPDSDGGEFEIRVGDQRTKGRVRGTGQPVTDQYTLLVLRGGEQTLELRPTKIAGGRLMTLRSITLSVPAAATGLGNP